MVNAPKVLYVEDDHASRMLIAKVLDNSPFDCFEAPDGMSGLQKAQEIIPDLILMDLNLPDMRGIDLATQLKTLPELSKTIIIALTATRESHARELSLTAGCDGYITKPIDTKNFARQISEFLEGKREVLDEESRAFYKKEYQRTLINHLTDKIKQLQTANYLLKDSTHKLRNYSGKLESLLHIIAGLQLCTSPEEVKHQLVEQISSHFNFQRCAFLEVNHESMQIGVTYSTGFSDTEALKIRLPYHATLVQSLFSRKPLLYISSSRKVKDDNFNRILDEISATQFLFGILGTSMPAGDALPGTTNIRRQLDALLPGLNHQSERDIEMVRSQLHEYLSSEMFYFGGFLYIDRPISGRITPYDVKLLEMLINAASLAHQNLQLRQQLTELFLRAEKDAITDHLTSLYNYRYFHQQLLREVSRSERTQTNICLLMLDIDFIKVYNDTFGHQAGDVVLRKVSRLLLENTRSSDIVARYGGEEFVIICTELDKAGGIRLAEKICNIIATSPFPQEDQLPHKKVTISIGVANFPNDSLHSEELIRFADSALYAAKENGRNQVRPFKIVIEKR